MTNVLYVDAALNSSTSVRGLERIDSGDSDESGEEENLCSPKAIPFSKVEARRDHSMAIQMSLHSRLHANAS